MQFSQAFVMYLICSFMLIANVPQVSGGEYHSEYPSYEAKHEYHHHEYHPPPPPPAKKAVDITIPIDFGTIAKLGVLGLTQLKLLLALGKVAGAGLGVSALGLGQLGKIALSVSPVHKGHGIAIDIGAGHAKSHSHYEHTHHAPEKHY